MEIVINFVEKLMSLHTYIYIYIYLFIYLYNMGHRCTAFELVTNNYQSEVTPLNIGEQNLKLCNQYRLKL
jgi:hypothetical protein